MSHGVAVVTSWFLFAFFSVYYPCPVFGLEVTMSNKHLTYDDRLTIQAGLQQGLKIAQIAKSIGKDRSTVGREIKAHRKLYPPSYLYQNPELSFRLLPWKEAVPDSMWTMPGRMP